ncbi:hypothetical protein BDM02DRAFT_1230013 [Thelephora ganbajun]|uniref:Uncharacterized protein n=1 Tax=Thelephora ganbajun TaxID=370292 RepID=A0ACB6Z3J8_THEGA|nr:hypothetical protein BDM02DRAFT_1230013 [Thelephora ganbajun]
MKCLYLCPKSLTATQAFEALDLSRNRTRSFPEQPGSLSNLRVLSLLKNKIAVPPQFQSLRIFKADQNPFEYPPMSVTDWRVIRRIRNSWNCGSNSTASEQKLVSRSPIMHKAERPPQLNLSLVPSFIPTVTHTDSPTSPPNYPSTPDNTVSFEEDTAKVFRTNQWHSTCATLHTRLAPNPPDPR